MTVIIYLDDLLILGRSKSQAEYNTELVKSLLIKLGFLISILKSALDPKQKFLYLGLWWDLVNWEVSLAIHRVTSIKTSARGTRL